MRSVLLQGYPNLEYIVMDGGSQDQTVHILVRYDPWLTEWASERDRGQSHAINKGFSLASGVIYGWLNSDDSLMPGALEAVARAYRADPQAGGWFGGCRRVDLEGILLDIHWPARVDADGLADWENNWVQQPACFFSGQSWKACDGLDESLQYAMDFDYWIKLAKQFPIRKIDRVLATARIHHDAKTRKFRTNVYAETWAVLSRHGFMDVAVREMMKRFAEPEAAEAFALHDDLTLARNEISRLKQELEDFRNSSPWSAASYRAYRDMAKAYSAYEQGHWIGLRRSLWSALRHDPSLLFKRGFLSILAQAYGLYRVRTKEQN